MMKLISHIDQDEGVGVWKISILPDKADLI